MINVLSAIPSGVAEAGFGIVSDFLMGLIFTGILAFILLALASGIFIAPVSYWMGKKLNKKWLKIISALWFVWATFAAVVLLLLKKNGEQ